MSKLNYFTLNAQGEVIAVNSAIIGGTQGLGFAIPINTAQKIARQLITTGKVEHPYIGIEMVSLTPQVKQKFNQIPNRKQDITSDKPDGMAVRGRAEDRSLTLPFKTVLATFIAHGYSWLFGNLYFALLSNANCF